jgi:hypothetical protein
MKLMQTGKIKQDETAKDVWDRLALFQKYPMHTFRQNFNNMKKQVNFHSRTNVLAGECLS